ncbi:MAG: monovalent cation:proton antiporter-2 (CPA2) family protein [Gammaproteobacteria bacterium]|nr:monovalent cation:proton antiporter-2 (CPA2) family protein [Gammaproteobacteria bacterium]MDH3907947.1 monovalent cation:proton antiporter-2 (CPA2) family protein [Gammaproteobacteria bacterium]MDH3953174.1 monovalent cation:proton antiporter-2 (CPA2) family protein [Gammaproteobacteria bacterium]MDH4006321.1 monovalent cation:proton antiporter-2 (CPA2) family protein [Gammaproteobacteria bacterium]NCF59951.1 potassium transporter KefC [Gammaproteobacteria bacterium]
MANYLLDIVILLTAAVVAVPLFRAAGFGAVPGFLVAGILVGPSGLALIDGVSEIGQLAELGVILLLFVIGIELKPARLWRMRRLVFGLGTLQIAITGALLTVGVRLLLDIPYRVAILIGLALALSSTAFVLQLLAEQKMLKSGYGRASLAVLLLQDLAVVPLLALVPLLAAQEFTIGVDIAFALLEAAAILALVVVFGRFLLHPILHRVAHARSQEIFTALVVVLVLGSALLTEHIGLSMAMGAFIAGLLIADSPYRHGVVAEIHPFRGLLLGLFFMSMGMSINLSAFLAQPFAILGLLVLLIVIKFGVLWPLASSFGLGTRTGAAVALLLAQSGEFGLILFAYTHQLNLIDAGLFQQLLLVVVLSMLVTPVIGKLAQRLATPPAGQKEASQEPPAPEPVLVAGFGRVGRRIGQILEMAGKPYVAIDFNSSLVLRERANGHRIFYGDVRRPEVLRAAGIADANLVIVTLDDFEATEDIVTALRQVRPNVTILVRGHNADQCRTLRKLGASLVVSENLEASLELAREALLRDHSDADEAESLILRFRDDHYASIEGKKPAKTTDRTGAERS